MRPPRMIQLPLDLPRRTAFGRSDFLASASNLAAVEWIDRWPAWPSRALLLHGPSGCGKTHLAHLWRHRASAVIIAGATVIEASLRSLLAAGPHGVAIDDAERASERALLHLYNSCVERGATVLITARRPAGSWGIALDDLRSRLRAVTAVGIDAPDDALLGAVLVKHFADRQLRVEPEVIVYLMRRIERSLAAAERIVTQLDAAALRNGSSVTIPLARKVMADLGDQPLSPRNDSKVT